MNMRPRPSKPVIVRIIRSLKRQYHRLEWNQKKTETPHQVNERMMALWTRRLGIFTVILAIIGAITAYILYETDQTSRLRDRAFIYFGDPSVTPYPPNQPILWAAGIAVGNAGNMPARRVSIRFACPDAPHSEGIQDPFPLAKWQAAQIGSVIGIKQGLTLQGCEIPIDVINDARNLVKDVFYVVEIRYIDGFDLDTPRLTQVSRIFYFDKWGGQSLGFIGPHNCSDDDCSK